MTNLGTRGGGTQVTTEPPRAPSRVSPRWVLGGIIDRARSGELGSLPVIAGVIIVWAVFESISPVFLTSRNLVQLAIQMSPIGVIALGIVFTLLTGQIDLSVGSMSGVAAAIAAILFIRLGLPVGLAIIVAILAGTFLGLVYSTAFNRFGIPSFVATLAGLLALLGVQLRLLGNSGSINIPFTSFLGQFGNVAFLPAWLTYVIAVLAAAVTFYSRWSLRRSQLSAGLQALSISAVVSRAVLILVLLGVSAWYLNRDRGVAWIFVFFVGLVVISDYLLRRTRWGRSVYAVGGNVEAARRSGIKVNRTYLSAFVICSTLAALGGVLFAAYDVSASNQTGTGDVNLDAIAAPVIGGVSLFGGRGTAYAALLGMLVIQSISNGLALISPSPDLLYIVTGVVLLLAVGLDSVARRSRKSSGRA
ncbi:MAG: sugar ABC transporter permease [Marmoricola sp.]